MKDEKTNGTRGNKEMKRLISVTIQIRMFFLCKFIIVVKINGI